MSNTIIRAPRRDRFLIIDQRAIEDERLSWAARGLLGYLLSKPDDWKVLVNDLRKRGDLGRDGIYRLLRELRDTGYMQFVRERDRQGRIRGGFYVIREIADSPHPDLPDTEERQTAAPATANPGALPTTDTNLKKTTTTTYIHTKECSRKNAPTAIGFAFWVPEELWPAALDKVAALSSAEGQMIIDEWAGCMAAGLIDISPVGYLQALVRRYQEGRLTLVHAREVADIRAKPIEEIQGSGEIGICAVKGDED